MRRVPRREKTPVSVPEHLYPAPYSQRAEFDGVAPRRPFTFGQWTRTNAKAAKRA